MDGTQIEDLIAVIAVVTGLSVAYGKAFGGYQMEISQAVIDALKVKSQYKRLVNLGVGMLIAIAFTLVGAAWLDSWEILPAGILAGVLASVEANKAHDQETRATLRQGAALTGERADAVARQIAAEVRRDLEVSADQPMRARVTRPSVQR